MQPTTIATKTAGETVTKVEVKTKKTKIAPAEPKTVMGKKLADSATPPNIGDLIEGSVIAIDKKGLFIDLPPFGTGIIYGREYILARDVIKKINIGDKVSAKIVDPKNADGYIELSLKEARQALIWTEAEQAI
ncbi:MAG TPA: S1 RNA-binding domain-containing protein, partial [Candidatus Paceibacterota bacterium]